MAFADRGTSRYVVACAARCVPNKLLASKLEFVITAPFQSFVLTVAGGKVISMSVVALAEGSIFAGRYKIVRSIAAGGMGAVYEVLHVETGRRRARKGL